MNRTSLSLSLLSAGVVTLGSIGFFVLRAIESSYKGMESEFVFGGAASLLILSAMIVALPARRWWKFVSQSLSILFLVAGCLGILIPNTIASRGLYAALVLLAIACVATTRRTTAGRWIVALPSSALLGLMLFSALAPAIPEFDIRITDKLADIDSYTKFVFATAGFALLIRAWIDAPIRSLRMPNWIGLSVSVICIALSFCAWNSSGHYERMNVQRNEQNVTEINKIVKFVAGYKFDQITNDFKDFAQDSPQFTESNRVTVFNDAKDILKSNEAIIAIGWLQGDSNITWVQISGDFSNQNKLYISNIKVDPTSLERAKKVDQVIIDRSIELDAKQETLLMIAPPGLDVKSGYAMLVNIGKMMDLIEKTFADGFQSEIYLRNNFLCERGDNSGANILGNGQEFAVGGDSLEIRLQQTLALSKDLSANYSKLLLGLCLTASILLGLTLFFAQASAHRANLSVIDRSRLEQLIEGAKQVAIVATDPSGLITIFNHAAERLSGWEAANVLGKLDASCLFDRDELNEIISPTPKESSFAALAILATSQRAHERDWTWKRPDSGQRRMNLAANPWKDSNGNLLGYLFVAVDVTERESAMRALDHARKIADRANNMKSSFLANVSHEIRTPMTAILGYADLLSDGTTSESERIEFAQTVKRNGQHLLEVLNDILDISKIEAGQLKIEMLEVRLVEIVDEVIQLMQLRAKERSLKLTVIKEGDDIDRIVRTDPLRVRQILVNLIGNALKFTERGSVTVLLRGSIEENELLAEIEVRDTGIGILEEHIKVLFQSFEQGNSSTARRFGGTGLGLAISQRLARLLNGAITVRSKMNQGSSFTFSFQAPLATSYVEETNAGSEIERPIIRLEGRRILLVDDSVDNRRLVSMILRRSGAEIEVAEDGRTAIAAIVLAGSQREFDVILLDMQMPEMDGYATARELRASGYRGRIVALTGNAAKNDRDRCIEAGCDDYLLKPVVREKLIAICAPLPPSSA